MLDHYLDLLFIISSFPVHTRSVKMLRAGVTSLEEKDLMKDTLSLSDLSFGSLHYPRHITKIYIKVP